jgi:serine/threonine-protein kinase
MAPTFNPGHDLAGRYRIIELLGVGHTAEVYRAEDTSLNRTVVVKVLLANLAAHEEVRRAFRNRIVRSATLSHPHLARIFDGGQESGAIFMISEYLSGGSLEDVLASGRRLSTDDGARLGRDVTSALAYIHANDFVLGDLSPSKLLFDEEGRVRVSDVALAGLGAQYRERLTLDDVRYLSPEQVLGEPVGPKTDVYALALILFEAVTGTTPFEGMSAEVVLRSRINQPLPIRPELGTLDMLLAQAAVPDPVLRLDAGQFNNRLSAVVTDGAPLVITPSSSAFPLLGQRTALEPRTSIGFRTPSPDQITGATAPVPSVLNQFPQSPPPRKVVSSPIAREHEFRELRSSGARGYDDLPVNRPDRKRRLGFILAALLILVVGVAGAATWKFGLLTSKHTVPSLEGLTLTQAAPVLKDDGFTLKVNHEVHSSTVPANTILSQNPAKGTNAKSGLVIVVTVSKGPSLVTLPTSLIGETCASATARLHSLKVNAKCPTSSEVASTRTAAGLVAEVLYGKTKNPLSVPLGSTVTLAISTGSSGAPTTTTTLASGTLATVPDFVGMSQAQVIAAVRSATLYYTTTGPGAGTTKWTKVLSQSVTAGTKVKTGSTVVLGVTNSGTVAPTTTTTLASGTLATVPDFVGMSQAQVIAAVRSATLYYTTTGPGAGTTKWTKVLSQSVTAGTKVKTGSTVVLGVTNSGTVAATTTTTPSATLHSVPNVVGMDFAQVNAAFKSAGLYFTTTGPGAGTTKWTAVVSENPGAGTKVKAGSTVTLTVR